MHHKRVSRHDILHEYRVDPSKVVVTYPGVGMELKVKSEKSKVSDTYIFPPRYILSVGTLQPRKNYVRLIEAFSSLKSNHSTEYKDVELCNSREKRVALR